MGKESVHHSLAHRLPSQVVEETHGCSSRKMMMDDVVTERRYGRSAVKTRRGRWFRSETAG